MESMNLLDITIKYFNVIIFVFAVIFGMISFFASWIAWREIHRKKNIIRSIIAAYNISEDALEKGRGPSGGFRLDQAIVQTVLNNIEEILNAIHGEITGKSIPAREDRVHGSRLMALRNVSIFKRRKEAASEESDSPIPTLVKNDAEHHGTSPNI